MCVLNNTTSNIHPCKKATCTKVTKIFFNTPCKQFLGQNTFSLDNLHEKHMVP
jgi:hypothetical protein